MGKSSLHESFNDLGRNRKIARVLCIVNLFFFRILWLVSG